MHEFIKWILSLFGKKPMEEKDISQSKGFEDDYEAIDKISFAAIFGNTLSNKVISDSTVDIVGADDKISKRSEFINAVIQSVWKDSNKITSQAVGKGGKIIVPYVADGKPCFDIIDQSRFFISDTVGNTISSATILADVKKVNDNLYYRWADYTLKGGNHIITNKATDKQGNIVGLDICHSWATIDEEIVISNVDRLLLGFYKNVTDNRGDKNYYGVPITYGSESIIKQIYEHLNIIQREYKLTRPMLGLDATMWDLEQTKATVQDKNTPFVKLFNDSTDNKTLWEIYSPAIRDDAMFSRLKQLYEQLETSVGTSRGILTELTTSNATATEILQSQYDTFCVVEALRTEWQKVIEDLAYSYDVLAEYYGLTPTGARNSYKIIWDWDMRLTENSAETFAQLSEMQSKGVVSKAELRQWKKGGTLSENQEVIDEITKNEPGLRELIGAE